MGWHRAACRETVRLIKRLHQYDVMRANKAPFAFGLEPRVPFLDKEFLDVSMTLDPADKMVCSLCFEPCVHSISPTSQGAVLRDLQGYELSTPQNRISSYLDPACPLSHACPKVNVIIPCLHG